MSDEQKTTRRERWLALEQKHLDSAQARLAKKTIADARGCLVWQGCANSKGYGQMSVGGKVGPGYPGWVECTHRVAYALRHGVEALFSEQSIDHVKEKCAGNKLCCNPDHMEVVGLAENTLRGDSPPAVNARKTICSNGHELTPENLLATKRGDRRCRQCNRKWERESYHRTKAAQTP